MDIFPALPGLTWDVQKTPEFSTLVQKAVSGRETRLGRAAYPLYTFGLKYDLLRDDQTTQTPASPYAELKTLLGFFLQQNGSRLPFLYTDPSDYAAVSAQFGAGDGSTLVFPLARSYGAGGFTFSEPVKNLNVFTSVTRTDWEGVQLMYATPRTNLLLRSGALHSSPWTQSRVIVSPSGPTAPDGVSTSDFMHETATTGTHVVGQAVASSVAGTRYTFSGYFQQHTNRYVQLALDDGTFVAYAYFDLQTGMVSQAATATGGWTGVTAAVTAMAAAGWYRCELSAILGAPGGSGVTASAPLVTAGTGGAIPSYAGNSANGVYGWGGQLETDAARATSYVATTAAAVTTTDYALSGETVTMGIAPATGATLQWNGTYYYRARFVSDATEFNEFMSQLWENQQLQFVGSIGDKV